MAAARWTSPGAGPTTSSSGSTTRPPSSRGGRPSPSGWRSSPTTGPTSWCRAPTGSRSCVRCRTPRSTRCGSPAPAQAAAEVRWAGTTWYVQASDPRDGGGLVPSPTTAPTTSRLRRLPRRARRTAVSEHDASYVEFVAARQPTLRRIAYAVCRDDARAEDVLQEALVKLYLAWSRVQGTGREEAYARRIIVNADLDQRRRPWHRRRSAVPVELLDAPGAHGGAGRGPDGAAGRAPRGCRRCSAARWCCATGWASRSRRPPRSSSISEGTVKSHASRGLATLRDGWARRSATRAARPGTSACGRAGARRRCRLVDRSHDDRHRRPRRRTTLRARGGRAAPARARRAPRRTGDAVLREDQWAAIEALAVDRRRALVVQRTGWGKSAVYFVATKLLREAGAGPDRHRQPAARADAQPDRGRRARRHPRGDHQLHQHRPVAADPRPDPRRRGRRPAGEPGAAQQPRLPRRGAAAARRHLRPARRRRGPLHLRLGPRLPPRLPPPPHPARRAAVRHPRARHDRDRQRPRDRRRRRAAGRARRRGRRPDATRRSSCSAAPSTGSRCASASSS